ncbi:MAG: GreA/GreB family elongation factor [Actinomycetales bacterium]|nr:GreA/GreB family elongation factor [Actinomycetales bacterium]
MSARAQQVVRPGERDGRPQLTADGRRLLQERLAQLRQERLTELRPLLAEQERDERIVADFERLMAQADEIEALVASADVIDDDPAAHDGRVDLGMRVQVRIFGEETWIRPVHPQEAFLDEERVSAASPIAIALMGARAGHTVWVDSPTGAWPCEVLAVAPAG